MLSTFISSNSNFQRLATLDSKSPWPGLFSNPSTSHTPQPESQQTLVILDSSFNPPSKAHFALALTALSRSKSPSRLLLLLGTKNADKHAPTPATPLHRLAMLLMFATDLHDTLSSGTDEVPVDIGLVNIPYFADKAAAIEQTKPAIYAEGTRQIHVMGYDTIVRLLAPRYYAQFNPPLSALEPLFGRAHEALVVLRPDGESSVEEQMDKVRGLITGKLTKEGFKDEWQALVDMVESKDAAGISSTEVRKAAEAHEWDVVESMCTPSVAAWIRDQGLFGNSEKDNKI
jgi:nicotinamide-nucleotide adenylyltransferase